MFNQAKLAVLLGTILVSSSAMAISDNTITFKGQVAAETCSIVINGETAKPVVLLPTVSTSALGATGSVAGATTFDITITNCPASTTERKMSTVFIGNAVTNAGNLANTGSASNVEIQILDTAGTKIDLRNEYKGNQDITVAANATTGSATYTAQYYAADAATAGTVVSTLQYAIDYQ